MGTSTLPELFIIESLKLEDEEDHAHEGEILARTLRLSGKSKTKYFYIRTERELDEIIDLFDESQFRYLHLSCHANKTSMGTTFDSVRYAQLGKKLENCLEGRRVFVSACQMANEALAAALLKDTGCYSLIGPKKTIAMDDAAAFWVTFYHLMFKLNDQAMKRRDIQHYVRELSMLFKEPINYYAVDNAKSRGFKKVDTSPRAVSGSSA
jgi:hypothetical protein